MSAEQMGWDAPYAALEALWFPKEHDVDDNGDDTDGAGGAGGANDANPYAERRAQLDAQFRALPRPGTPAYWQALEGTAEQPPPLGVLARCVRERWEALAADEAGRIFALLMARTWAEAERMVKGKVPVSLADEIMQDGYLSLWKGITEKSSDFPFQNCSFALRRLVQRARAETLRREGFQLRKGTDHSMRLPHRQQVSLSAPLGGSDEHASLEDVLADPTAEEAYRVVEHYVDVRAMLEQLTDVQRALFFLQFDGSLTQRQLAKRLGVTDRTIRTRLVELYETLRKLNANASDPPSRTAESSETPDERREADDGKH